MCLSGVVVFTATSRAVSVLKIKYFFKGDHNVDPQESCKSRDQGQEILKSGWTTESFAGGVRRLFQGTEHLGLYIVSH